MPLTQHLEELRACLIRALVGFAVCTAIALVFADDIVAFIITPALIALNAHGERPELLALSPMGPFMTYLRVAFLSGLVVSTPWVVYQLWMFVSSGLYPKERGWVKRFLPITVGLFAAGVSFMFFIVLPIVLNYLVTFNQGFDLPSLRPTWFQRLLIGQSQPPAAPPSAPLDLKVPVTDHDPENPEIGTVWYNAADNALRLRSTGGTFSLPAIPVERRRSVASQFGLQDVISLAFGLALGFGLAFELPIVVVGLSATGIVPCATMAKSRRYILFGIVVAAAVLTPPDVLSQILLAVPMYGLFEGGLVAARVMESRRRRAHPE